MSSAERRRVVVLSFSPIHEDVRVSRQIVCLAADHDVTVVGYGHLNAASERAGATMCSVPEPPVSRVRTGLSAGCMLLGRALPHAGYWGWDWQRADHRAALSAVAAARPEIIVANDWDTLPTALRAQARHPAKILADLHEYAPLHFENRRPWMLLVAPMIDFHLRGAVPHIARAITVNQTIADKYRDEYGLTCEVVRNIPAATPVVGTRATDPRRIRLVHHGNATRDRQLHLMIEAVAKADERFSLHFMLREVHKDYVVQLRELAATRAPGRVHFEATVPPADITATIAQYDIGIFLLPPVTFNYHAALPNKFFEFLAAGLAVCVGPSPEMASITRQHGCGVVTPDFDPATAAASLNALSAGEIDTMKQRSLLACGHYRFEGEMQVLRSVMARVVEGT